MGFKIEKDIPISKFYSKFCETLDKLQVGESIGGLTKEQAYKYRVNFYTKNFKDRKFRLGKCPHKDGDYRIWRVDTEYLKDADLKW